MDYNNIFDEFMKRCGDSYSNESKYDNKNDSDDCTPPPGVADEECRNTNSDIPGGFQDLDPMTFTVIAEIIGNTIASNIPFNLQNAISNWLYLVAQSISTFNSQQQYFQGGPGRYYNPIYRNSANPFCENTSDESGENIGNTKKKKTSGNINEILKKNKDLESKIESLANEINKLKEEMQNLKNNI